jgi:hypothetical protein
MVIFFSFAIIQLSSGIPAFDSVPKNLRLEVQHLRKGSSQKSLSGGREIAAKGAAAPLSFPKLRAAHKTKHSARKGRTQKFTPRAFPRKALG